MPQLFATNENGPAILSVEDWERHARPAGGFVPLHSAHEFAHAWFPNGPSNNPSLPLPFRAMFASHELTCDLDFDSGVGFAEAVTSFDPYPGGVRNHDMLLVATDARVRGGGVRCLISVEAKAKEPFDKLVGAAYDAKDPLASGAPSNLRKRIQLLCAAVFGGPLSEVSRQIRYQLLQALAATIVEASERSAKYAVFIVWQFDVGDPTTLEQNRSDFERFVQVFAGDVPIATDRLYGPFVIHGNADIPGTIPFLIGKVVTKVS